ncbi:potassium channel family protein [Mycobacterium sp. IDR2000157661]|uniref:potassium channel family protein n=1 Tax=Mycobacterium sp. IDR2000157661 TaxID=2867005 RepID=UPI001EEC2247|nr:potassium channel family protein [Mycobacterium sp. IDR2000157661]ULE32271.1 potassium channel family protein [Mycobacterium sp. IDR2000157661]
MEWVLTVVGLLLVVAIVRDVFHTLFHPIGHGIIAPLVMRLIWRLLRFLPPQRRISTLTGPLGIAMVVLAWGLVAVVGWTLIYLAQMPDGFAYGAELDPSQRHDLLDSLYVSLVAVGTLGFGDIVPLSLSLRVLAPLEALFGFMLLTAAVSWVLEIYPALHRRRVLAMQLSTLRKARQAEPDLGIDDIPVDVLASLAASIVEARNDFTQYSATYYFRDLEADASLAASLEYATHLAAEATASTQSQVRLTGALMTAALDSLAELLDQEFLQLGGDTATVVRAYATDHRHSG